jgi:O-6-methylguanine DNA methyltransferase
MVGVLLVLLFRRRGWLWIRLACRITRGRGTRIRFAGREDLQHSLRYAVNCSGKTITYGELAALSGTGVPARAIGEIMAATPVPIIMPCHGVVASDGLGGYSGGEPGRHLETSGD